MVRSESVSRTRDDGVGQERGREILPANRVSVCLFYYAYRLIFWQLTHSGRGGAGNIRSPSRDPEADMRELSREREIIEDYRKNEEGQIVSPSQFVDLS